MSEPLTVWIWLAWSFGTVAILGTIALIYHGVRAWISYNRWADAVDDPDPNGSAELPPDKRSDDAL